MASFMDFLKGAGKVGLGFLAGGPVGAITAGVGSVLSGAAGGKADATAEQTAFEQNRNRQLLDQYGIQQGAELSRGGLDLQRKAFDESSEGSRYKRAMLGELLANVQDTNVSVPGITNATITGGLRPSALGVEGRAIGREMGQRALAQARAGNTYAGGGMVAPPNLAAVPKQGGGFFDTAALIARLAGVPGAVLGQPQPGQTDYTKIHQPKPAPQFGLNVPDYFDITG